MKSYRTARRASVLLLTALGIWAAAAGCGSGGGSPSPETAAPAAAPKATSEYVEVLTQMRAAATRAASYDGYGFAEYMPSTQRAAIDAFCAIAADVADEKLGPGDDLSAAITRTAKVDLKRERDIVAPKPTRRAIARLAAIVEPDSLAPERAEHYVHACYR